MEDRQRHYEQEVAELNLIIEETKAVLLKKGYQDAAVQALFDQAEQ